MVSHQIIYTPLGQALLPGLAENSGKVIARIIERMPPATLFAQETIIAGTSTPAENISVLAFDDTTDEYMDYKCELSPQYSGGGLTVAIRFSMASDHDEATPHIVNWQIGIRRIADDAEDLNGSHDYATNGFANNTVNATVPSVQGEVAYDTISISNGTNMDNLAAGEYFILRIKRDASPASGTDASGDAYLHYISIRET